MRAISGQARQPVVGCATQTRSSADEQVMQIWSLSIFGLAPKTRALFERRLTHRRRRRRRRSPARWAPTLAGPSKDLMCSYSLKESNHLCNRSLGFGCCVRLHNFVALVEDLFGLNFVSLGNDLNLKSCARNVPYVQAFTEQRSSCVSYCRRRLQGLCVYFRIACTFGRFSHTDPLSGRSKRSEEPRLKATMHLSKLPTCKLANQNDSPLPLRETPQATTNNGLEVAKLLLIVIYSYDD